MTKEYTEWFRCPKCFSGNIVLGHLLIECYDCNKKSYIESR